MDTKLLVKISNIIGLVATILLVYWIFTFILTQVFGLKIFREHLTNSFQLSIFGILALMAGALMLNIMLNLTRIAERGDEPKVHKRTKKTMFALLAVFPLIIIITFGGDYFTSQKKQQIFIQSAENMIETQHSRFQQLVNYQFTAPYIQSTAQNLEFLGLLNRSFHQVEILVPDKIQNNPVYLSFSKYPRLTSDQPLAFENDPMTAEHAAMEAAQAAVDMAQQTKKEQPQISLDKKYYVQQLSLAETDYLNSVFQNKNKEIKFIANDGSYELYYPYTYNNKTIVLYFTDQQRYGKFGS